MDEILRELLGVNKAEAFNFFLSGLKDVTKRDPNDEMFYVASILAHFSITSRYDTSSMPPLANLSEVFDQFVFFDTTDSEILEIGGSQVLLFAGFFRDQMKYRHSVTWYDGIGQSFYGRASAYSREAKRKRLFDRMSKSFPWWTLRCCDLSRKCRGGSNNRHIIKSN